MPTNGQFAVGELVTASDANTLFVRGYRNRIINGNFEINQRGYTSGTNLASGAYGFDRWKSGFTNTALTFTDGVQSTTVTISASGVLQQIVERANIPAGTYILSWTGTATGRIYNAGTVSPPAYSAGPITVTLNGAADVVVEFTASGGTRTLGLVQLEAGTAYSPFEYRHRSEEIILCQRYYEKSYDIATTPGTNTDVGMHWGDFGSHADATSISPIFFKVNKRVPTYSVSFWTNSGTANNWEIARSGFSGATIPVAFSKGTHAVHIYVQIGVAWTVALRYGHWAVDAEL